MFRVDNVTFNFGSEKILQDFSVDISSGEKIAFKGESGSGKTTILKMLMGFLQPDDGKILFNKKKLDIPTTKELRSECAWLPQDLNLGSDSVREVIEFPFGFRNNGSIRLSKKRLHSVLDQLGIESSMLDKNFRDLSTGQRQRIGLTICILLERSVLFLDEPTSALDENSVKKVIEMLLKDSGLTVISTSHDPVWLKNCSRVVEINKLA
ncbi:MAG: ABC transporter ATP-binding protein [Balneolaceae bacterium]